MSNLRQIICWTVLVFALMTVLVLVAPAVAYGKDQHPSAKPACPMPNLMFRDGPSFRSPERILKRKGVQISAGLYKWKIPGRGLAKSIFHPTTTVNLGLAYLEKYCNSRSQSSREGAERVYKHITRRLDNTGKLTYGLPLRHYNISAHWQSAIGTASAAAYLTAYSEIFSEDVSHYIDMLLKPFEKSTREGGLVVKISESAWFYEEVPSPDKRIMILNGHLIALRSLDYVSVVLNNSRARGLFRRGVQGVITTLDDYDALNTTYYQFRSLPKDPGKYPHRIHTRGLRWIIKKWANDALLLNHGDIETVLRFYSKWKTYEDDFIIAKNDPLVERENLLKNGDFRYRSWFWQGSQVYGNLTFQRGSLFYTKKNDVPDNAQTKLYHYFHCPSSPVSHLFYKFKIQGIQEKKVEMNVMLEMVGPIYREILKETIVVGRLRHKNVTSGYVPVTFCGEDDNQKLRVTLVPMTAGRPPDIKIDEITVAARRPRIVQSLVIHAVSADTGWKVRGKRGSFQLENLNNEGGHLSAEATGAADSGGHALILNFDGSRNQGFPVHEEATYALFEVQIRSEQDSRDSTLSIGFSKRRNNKSSYKMGKEIVPDSWRTVRRFIQISSSDSRLKPRLEWRGAAGGDVLELRRPRLLMVRTADVAQSSALTNTQPSDYTE